MGKKIILIVEGSQSLVSTLTENLKDTFYVLNTGNTDEAIEVIGTWQVDCLLTDIDSPGPELMNNLGKLGRALKGLDKVILTGTNPIWKKRADELGVRSLLLKPYGMDELIDNIRRAAC